MRESPDGPVRERRILVRASANGDIGRVSLCFTFACPVDLVCAGEAAVRPVRDAGVDHSGCPRRHNPLQFSKAIHGGCWSLMHLNTGVGYYGRCDHRRRPKASLAALRVDAVTNGRFGFPHRGGTKHRGNALVGSLDAGNILWFSLLLPEFADAIVFGDSIAGLSVPT